MHRIIDRCNETPDNPVYVLKWGLREFRYFTYIPIRECVFPKTEPKNTKIITTDFPKINRSNTDDIYWAYNKDTDFLYIFLENGKDSKINHRIRSFRYTYKKHDVAKENFAEMQKLIELYAISNSQNHAKFNLNQIMNEIKTNSYYHIRNLAETDSRHYFKFMFLLIAMLVFGILYYLDISRYYKEIFHRYRELKKFDSSVKAPSIFAILFTRSIFDLINDYEEKYRKTRLAYFRNLRKINVVKTHVERVDSKPTSKISSCVEYIDQLQIWVDKIDASKLDTLSKKMLCDFIQKAKNSVRKSQKIYYLERALEAGNETKSQYQADIKVESPIETKKTLSLDQLINQFNVRSILSDHPQIEYIEAIILWGLIQPGRRNSSFINEKYLKAENLRRNTRNKIDCFMDKEYEIALEWLLKNNVVIEPKKKTQSTVYSFNTHDEYATELGAQIINLVLDFMYKVEQLAR